MHILSNTSDLGLLWLGLSERYPKFTNQDECQADDQSLLYRALSKMLFDIASRQARDGQNFGSGSGERLAAYAAPPSRQFSNHSLDS